LAEAAAWLSLVPLACSYWQSRRNNPSFPLGQLPDTAPHEVTSVHMAFQRKQEYRMRRATLPCRCPAELAGSWYLNPASSLY